MELGHWETTRAEHQSRHVQYSGDIRSVARSATMTKGLPIGFLCSGKAQVRQGLSKTLGLWSKMRFWHRYNTNMIEADSRPHWARQNIRKHWSYWDDRQSKGLSLCFYNAIFLSRMDSRLSSDWRSLPEPCFGGWSRVLWWPNRDFQVQDNGRGFH